MKKEDCAFCYPESTSFPHFNRMGKERIDLVNLFKTDRLIIKPDALPASNVFHGLVIPNEHRFSFAQNQGLGEEVGHLLWEIEEKIGQSLAWFEHGGFQEGSKVQSVYHNHAHIMATEGKDIISYMQDVLNEEGVEYQLVGGLDYSPAFNLEHAPGLDNTGYIYIQSGAYGLIATDSEDEFPSQIAQRNMSKLFSGRALNWKNIEDDQSLAQESIVRIMNMIETCKQ